MVGWLIWFELVDLVGWLDGWMAIWLFNSSLTSNVPFRCPSFSFSFLFFFASEILKTKEEKFRSGQVIKSVEGKPKAESRRVKNVMKAEWEGWS